MPNEWYPRQSGKSQFLVNSLDKKADFNYTKIRYVNAHLIIHTHYKYETFACKTGTKMPDTCLPIMKVTTDLRKTGASVIMPAQHVQGENAMTDKKAPTGTVSVLDDDDAFCELATKAFARGAAKAVEENDRLGLDSPTAVDGKRAVRKTNGRIVVLGQN